MEKARSLFSLVFALVVVLSCGSETGAQARARCDHCGMRIDPTSGWRAGGSAGGRELSFDAPKCLFRYHHERGAVSDPWVIEYYTQARRPARDLFYVIGTDLEGPMGRDLVPVAGREAADRLMRDHHGARVLAFSEVTAEVTASLFGSRR